jgi:hypothetical protein
VVTRDANTPSPLIPLSKAVVQGDQKTYVWGQVVLSLLPGQLTKSKRQILKLTIKYQFSTVKKM